MYLKRTRRRSRAKSLEQPWVLDSRRLSTYPSTCWASDTPWGTSCWGVLGKTGNIPFVLATPLPYADLVVGIDIARRRREHLGGSINATAITRIYFGNGEFLRYLIHDAPLGGETIPENVLQALFPVSDFAGKRVVIHRDGYFRGDERGALRRWARQIGATFNLVEVIKTGTPRLYALDEREIQQPPKGSAFKLSDTEALTIQARLTNITAAEIERGRYRPDHRMNKVLTSTSLAILERSFVSTVGDVKRLDPLAPVTVVVGSNLQHIYSWSLCFTKPA